MSVRLVFVHSPLLGPGSWVPVSQEMVARGWSVSVPELRDAGSSPYWRQQVESVAGGLRTDSEGLVLIAHSGAGPLLAAVADELGGRVLALFFVDAGLPKDQASRLDLLRTEMGDTFADAFEAHLRSGGRYPQWGDADLAPSVHDPAVRAVVLASQRPRPVDFWTEAVPAPGDWMQLPCAYLQLSGGYRQPARRANEMGWPVIERPSHHFAILTEPALVAADLEALLARVRVERPR